MLHGLQQHKQYLLTGVSHVIPFIACGGILIASAIAFAPMTPAGPDFSGSPVLRLFLDVGGVAFALALPVLAGFVAFGIAGRPGLAPAVLLSEIVRSGVSACRCTYVRQNSR